MAWGLSDYGADVVKYYIDGENGVDGPGGNNGLAYTGSRGVGPWKTIQYALDVLATSSSSHDGDIFHIMTTSNDSLYYGLSGAHQTNPFGLSAGHNSQEVIFIGASTTGLANNTVVEIHGGSLDNSTSMLNINNATIDYLQFANVKFDGGGTAQYCVDQSLGRNTHNMAFINCRFTNAFSDGYNTGNTPGYTNFVHCRFDNNGGAGISAAHSNFSMYHKCLFDNNITDGARIGGHARVSNCVFAHNGAAGAIFNNSATVTDSIFDGNTGNGCQIKSTGQGPHLNCIYSNNGDYGLTFESAVEARHYMCNFYNNGSGNTAATGTKHYYLHDYHTTDPAFVDADNLDYTIGHNPNNYTNLNKTRGMNTHFKIYGSTSDSIGVHKWRKSENINIF